MRRCLLRSSLTLAPSADGYWSLLRQVREVKTILPNSATSTHILTSNSVKDIDEWKITIFPGKSRHKSFPMRKSACYMHLTDNNMRKATCMLNECCNRFLHSCNMHVSCNMRVLGRLTSM